MASYDSVDPNLSRTLRALADALDEGTAWVTDARIGFDQRPYPLFRADYAIKLSREAASTVIEWETEGRITLALNE